MGEKAGMAAVKEANAPAWPAAIHAALKAHDVRQVAYVPDGGHTELLRLVDDDPTMTPVLLTSEQEGVGVLTGAWLGGQRGVLLMQSSGVGNCINVLSLVRLCQLPFLALVTMRGEWGEFNPWQVPMGSATAQAFRLMGVQVQRVETPDEVGPVMNAACGMAFAGGTPMAVLLAQRLIGAKEFLK
jgi:sulfopyruvate decarboxylase alpha subunit